MNILAQVLTAIQDERDSLKNVNLSHDEELQHIDDAVTVALSNHGIANDEDAICDSLGLSAYHQIRDAQGAIGQ